MFPISDTCSFGGGAREPPSLQLQNSYIAFLKELTLNLKELKKILKKKNYRRDFCLVLVSNGYSDI